MEPDEPEKVTKHVSSAEAIAARREARRKRILENSNNRLTKITGREHNEEDQDNHVATEKVIYPDPEDERDVFEQQQPVEFPGGIDLGATGANGDVFSLLSAFRQAQEQSNGRIPPADAADSEGTTGLSPDSRLAWFLRTKVHIALTGILVYLLFATGRQALLGNSVFMLLLAWEVLEVFILKTSESPRGSVLDIVLLLGGISTKYTKFIIKFLQTTHKVLKDVAFFVFFFVLTHLAWSRFVLGIDLRYVLGYHQLHQEQPEVDVHAQVDEDDSLWAA